jgi:hypothetical protein
VCCQWVWIDILPIRKAASLTVGLIGGGGGKVEEEAISSSKGNSRCSC